MEIEEPKSNEPISDGKYTFSELYDYLSRREYPPDASKQYIYITSYISSELEKRSKYFITDEGRLYYIGGQKKSTTTPRLVVETVEERDRIVKSVHDQAHLGRDKMLSAVSAKYYWPNMYNEICEYVSFLMKCASTYNNMRYEHNVGENL